MEAVSVKPDFPPVIDNTMISDYILCEEKFNRSFIQNWAPMAPSIHLHAGGAFAKGLEYARRSFYEQGKSEGEARRDGLQALMLAYGTVEAPITRTGDKSLENVIRAYDSYMERYRLGQDVIKPHVVNGKAMVEFAFTIPTEIKHPQSGDPILYGGRADMIGEMNGALWVTDEKTASQLGEQWANQWDLDSQFTGYIAAASLYGFPVAGALIRGVGLLKTKITHAECQISRGAWFIERWWQELHKKIRRMVRSYESNDFALALAKGACANYGGCAFKMLCESPEPEGYLPIYFRQRVWNPISPDHGEKLIDQQTASANDGDMAPELEIPGLEK